MNNLIVSINGESKTIPYRTYKKPVLEFNRIKKLCLLSRYHDGHVREAAIRQLLTLKLPANAVPYIFIALADYVIEISTLPLEASDELQMALSKFIRANPDASKTVSSVIISYWNEYYRSSYKHYEDYPPYAYLQSLKVS